MISSTIGSTIVSSTITDGVAAGDKSKTSSNTATTSSSRIMSAAQTTRTVDGFRTEASRQELNKIQTALGKDIRTALSKTGYSLTGTIDFTVGSDGKVSVVGSDKDKAAVMAALKADQSAPSLESRIKALDTKAESFDKNYRQAATMQQAAKYAGRGTNLVQLYSSLMAKQTASSAVFSVSAKDSQIAFKGSVSAQA